VIKYSHLRNVIRKFSHPASKTSPDERLPFYNPEENPFLYAAANTSYLILHLVYVLRVLKSAFWLLMTGPSMSDWLRVISSPLSLREGVSTLCRVGRCDRQRAESEGPLCLKMAATGRTLNVSSPELCRQNKNEHRLRLSRASR
jgi:hypothetical protein